MKCSVIIVEIIYTNISFQYIQSSVMGAGERSQTTMGVSVLLLTYFSQFLIKYANKAKIKELTEYTLRRWCWWWCWYKRCRFPCIFLCFPFRRTQTQQQLNKIHNILLKNRKCIRRKLKELESTGGWMEVEVVWYGNVMGWDGMGWDDGFV